MREIDIRSQIMAGADNIRRDKSIGNLVVNAASGQPSYYNANEAVLNFYPEIREAMLKNTNGRRIKLSPGISELPTFPTFITKAQEGIANPNYYVNYSAPFGTTAAVDSLRRLESANLTSTDEIIYPPNGIFITPGGTGAINLAFEYFKDKFPQGKIAGLGLSYYVFPFIASRKELAYETILTDPLNPSDTTRFLPTPEEVARTITADTKMLIVTQPSNPTGEYYKREEIEQIVDLAIKEDLLLLSDNVFADLVYDKENFTTFEQVAFERGALDRVLTVRSYSKNYNIPGYRPGYLATSDVTIGQDLSFINERIMCCPPTVLTPLINISCLMQNIDLEQQRFPDKPLQEIVTGINNRYQVDQGPNAGLDIQNTYLEYQTFMQNMLSFYGNNFDLIRATLTGNVAAGNEKNAAFNTLIKLKDIPQGTNFFDFCVNLYLTCGIETQVGPCFGLTQNKWEEDLGFWLRVTYTLKPEDLQSALQMLVTFRDEYVKNPERFLSTGLSF